MSISKRNVDYTHRPHGKFGSYGEVDLITFQSKVNRSLFNRYDVIRRLKQQTRRESLEEFFNWTLDQHANSKGLFDLIGNFSDE